MNCTLCARHIVHVPSACLYGRGLSREPIDFNITVVDCSLCAMEHKEGECQHYPEGPGLITRIDRYTLSVDGKRIRATEDQERRIRALTDEQRENLLKILGLTVFRETVVVAVDPGVPASEYSTEWSARLMFINGTITGRQSGKQAAIDEYGWPVSGNPQYKPIV